MATCEFQYICDLAIDIVSLYRLVLAKSVVLYAERHRICLSKYYTVPLMSKNVGIRLEPATLVALQKYIPSANWLATGMFNVTFVDSL